MEQQWIKKVFEWVSALLLCIIISVIVRLIAVYFGAKETSAAMWSGMIMITCMYETGLFKARFRK